jgi:hypothetical protein
MANVEVRLPSPPLDTAPRTLPRQSVNGSESAAPDRRQQAPPPVRVFLCEVAGVLAALARRIVFWRRRLNVLNRFLTWRKVRRRQLCRQWLRQSRVILPEPDQRCRRNSVEAVP